MPFKKIVFYIDELLLGGWILHWRKIKAQKRLEDTTSLAYPNSLNFRYSHNPNSYLNVLCDKYGSDKGETGMLEQPYHWPSHTYTDVYEILFQLRRNNVELVIECGLGTNNPNIKSSMGVLGKPGASLRVWRDYFPNARIIGLDIDKDVLFEEERINTYFCDQTSISSINLFAQSSKLHKSSADIIIDDGLHEFFAGVCFFENMIQYLAPNGIYIIEDVTLEDSFLYINYFEKFKDRFSVRHIDLHRHGLEMRDNRLIVITFSQNFDI